MCLALTRQVCHPSARSSADGNNMQFPKCTGSGILPQSLGDEYLVSWLVGALSPVNHKGLHQGWGDE